MNSGPIHSLLSSLDNAVEILAENRTSDAMCVAAFDTLKQARALVARAFSTPSGAFDRAATEDAAQTAAA